MRNMHVALMVSQGTPMVLMGDEYGHTRHGNNNTYGGAGRILLKYPAAHSIPSFLEVHGNL